MCRLILGDVSERPEFAVYIKLIRLTIAKRNFHTVSPCFPKCWHLLFSAFDYFLWEILKHLVVGPLKAPSQRKNVLSSLYWMNLAIIGLVPESLRLLGSRGTRCVSSVQAFLYPRSSSMKFVNVFSVSSSSSTSSGMEKSLLFSRLEHASR